MKEKGKKSRFQAELEKVVSRRIVVTILTGCLFFCAAFLGITMLNQQLNQKKHLDGVTETFYEVYDSVAHFMEAEENQESFIRCVSGDVTVNDKIRYQISKYNVDAPVGIHVMITDAKEETVFSNYFGEMMNLHRAEFNRIAGENARKRGKDIYTTVYYFSGDTSEYVMSLALYQENEYIGNVTAYLDGNEWGQFFSKYQYDTIITNKNQDIIYCSNNSFLKERNANKYKPANYRSYIWVEDSRYLIGMKDLADKGVRLYSFIYSPKNYVYIGIGVGTILILGCIWTIMFLQMLGIMAKKTSESVETLVSEIRYIRKEDASHIISIHTGDEIEEIAEQINKMIKSINDLNVKNMDLIRINSRMEIQNLQAQINPHFIYNTLDNIKYLIVQDSAKAEELIERFTHILRYSINNTKRKVSLQEDLEYIEDYLVIQKTRFGSRFEYTVAIEDECGSVLIPKLLLQPLIENSIKYGFRKKTTIHVDLKGYIEKNYLCLMVTDDGAGVPKATLETLRTMLKSEEIDTVHNGLQNINRRVMLEYGKESGILLSSIDGEEFQVLLKLWLGDE